MSGTSAPHWPALDGLRGLAVIGVVAFHIDRLDGGFLGVDLFFTLSGFLITTLLLREHETAGAIRLGRFWLRRFRRLLPAVMVLLGVVLCWLAIWGTPAEQATSREDARWALPYLANWHMIAAARDYWASATSASAFTHLWSLAIEEQFYVLWPVVVWALVRRGRLLSIVTVAATVGSAAAMVLLAERSGATRAYMGTDTRAAALLLGALAALVPVRRATAAWVQRHQRRADALLLAAVGVLVSTWWLGGRDLDLLLRGGLVLHSAAAAVIVGLLAAPSPSTSGALLRRAGRELGRRPLVWVGTMSYGIYLWHWPLLLLGRPRMTGLPDLVRDLVLVAIAVMLAAISYHLVEQPVRRQRAWAVGRRATLATVVLTAVAATVVVAAPSGRGSIATFDPGSIAAPTPRAPAPSDPTTTEPIAPLTPPSTPSTMIVEADRAANARPTAAAAQTSTTTTDTTTDTTTTVAVARGTASRVLWIGDSIAADLAPAVLAALEASGVEAADGAFAGRRLVKSGNVDTTTLYPELLAEHEPDVVVVQLSLWDSPFPLVQLREAFAWFHDLVRSSGADLVFVTHPPLRFDLIDLGIERQLQVVAELVALDPAHVRLLDPTPVWGAAIARDLDGDRIPDRKWDLVHVCPQGAARFAHWLAIELADRFEGMRAPDLASWVTGPWTTDPTYDNPVGSCALLTDTP